MFLSFTQGAASARLATYANQLPEGPQRRRPAVGWLPNPIDWSPIDRGLFLTAIALCVSCSNVAFLSWLSHSSIGDQLNPDFYPVTLGIAMALTAGALSLLLRGLLRRRHVKDWPFLSELLAHGVPSAFSFSPMLRVSIQRRLPLFWSRASRSACRCFTRAPSPARWSRGSAF